MALPIADVIMPIASPTPFRNLLSEFAKLIDSQGISIDMLIKSIDNLGEEYKTFKVEDKYLDDFIALVRDELSNRVNSLFKNITDKLIAKNPQLAHVFQLSNNSDKDFEKIGNFTIHLSYYDKKTKTNKEKEVILTYGELLTKYNTFKNIIQSAFSNIELITSQREFTESFFNDAVSTINMHVSTSRDFFDTEGVSKQCDTAYSIKWPYSLIPVIPERFSDSYSYKEWINYCYICGKVINTNNGPSQCEHILPVFQACTFNCLIQVSTDLVNATPERKALYKLEYAGSHPCCNILKSNNSFINIDPTKDPPISVNYSYIATLLNIINSKASDNNSNCYDLLIADITAQVKVIDELYLKDLVAYLNSTLKANDGTFATSGIILLFLTINQFIAFQPAIEQTIISILSGGVKKIKKIMQFKLYSIDTFFDKELSKIMKLAYDSKEVDTTNYLDFIGLVTNVDEYQDLLKYIQNYVELANPARKVVSAQNPDFFYTNIRDMMSHMKQFEFHKIFLNTDNFDKMEEMTNPSNYNKVSYPNAGANNLFQEKIKYFFKSLVYQFYGVKSGDDESWFTTISDVQISKKEKDSLIEFCKAYIGLEFLYIIIYKLSIIKIRLEQPFIYRLQNCYEKYKQCYITFINYFFIYQSFYILSTNDNITIANLFPIDSMDMNDKEDLKKIIIYYAGTTYYNIWNILLTKKKSILEQFVTKAVEIMNALEEKNKTDEETVNITNGVNMLTLGLVNILTELFDDPEVKRCLIIYQIDMGHAKPLGSAKIHDRRNLTPLPELPQAGGVHESNKNRNKLTRDYTKHQRQNTAIRLQNDIKHANRDMNRMPLDKLETFINDIKRFDKESLLTELSSKSTHYNLRQNPTQMLQFNVAGTVEQPIATFRSANFIIYVYEPAIYLDIYRCILIDVIDGLFKQKIEDMINTKAVYSNDEILTDEDIALLQNVITGEYLTLLMNNKYFFTTYPEYLYLFTKCNLFLFYHSTSGYITDLFDNKLYATKSMSKGGGKKYYKNITKKKVKKTKEKLKTKTRKHKLIKHKSKKHKSRKHKT
jgi:hypothetical protein